MKLIDNLASVRFQLQSALETVCQLEQSEFPYPDPRIALAEIRSAFEVARDNVELIDSGTDPETIDAVCASTYKLVSESLEILGILLRSTNVRNAFEFHGPLRRLAKRVLGNSTNLVISSEWQFSPYNLVGYLHLPGFALIGLPATESDNPLLLPLAGHELGHSAWRAWKIEACVIETIQAALLESIQGHWEEYSEVFSNIDIESLATDLLARQTWLPALEWAIMQCEESFCDVIGVRLFGESYLQAFAYFLAPDRASPRSPYYPSLRERAALIAEVARSLGVSAPSNYAASFAEQKCPSPSKDRLNSLLLMVADSARRGATELAVKHAMDGVDAIQYDGWNDDCIGRCMDRFQLAVPTVHAGSLSNIVNAAWRAILAQPFFPDDNYEKQKKAIITELALKSIEILEIECRIEGPGLR